MPEFTITLEEEDLESIVLRDVSPRSVWLQALEPLEKMRREHDLVKMFPSYLSGEDLYGLTEPTVTRIMESVSPTYHLCRVC